MSKKPWDLTSRHSLESAASWIGKGSDARVVLVIREADLAVFIHRDLQPFDAIQLVRNRLPFLLQHLIDQRAGVVKEKTKAPVNPDAEDPE